MAVARKRSAYQRKYYEKKRKTILARARAHYRANRSAILLRQKKYRQKTKAGTSAYKPLYLRGSGKGKRPLYARLPRLNAYSFIGRKKGKKSKAMGRRAPSFLNRKKTAPRRSGRAFGRRK